MKEKIKTAVKISVTTALKWALIVSVGTIVTLITLFLAIYVNIDIASGDNGSFISLFLGLITTNFFAFLLIFGSPVFIALYFILANKISIQNAIYLLWQGEAGDYVSSKVESVTKILTEKEGWRKDISDKAVLKAQILQSTKNEANTSKLQRKIIDFGFQKIQLDDVDFHDENLNVSDIVVGKFNSLIEETTKPSLQLFWMLMGIQIALSVGSVIMS